MGRLFLMALLALDLLVMGTSGYILWDRVRKNLFEAPASAVSTPVPEPAAVAAPSAATAPLPDSAAAEMPAVQPEKTESIASKKISFHYRDPLAKRVSILGDFNQWSPQLMKKDSSQRWSVTLNLKPGQYEYNFLVDGKTIRDPSQKASKKRAGRKIPASLLTVKAKP